MNWRAPQTVTAPKRLWHLFAVVEEGEAGGPAYAIGTWAGKRRIGFRWNGTPETPKGNPISSGHPTWTMLDQRLHAAVIALLAPEQQAVARQYFAEEESGRA